MLKCDFCFFAVCYCIRWFEQVAVCFFLLLLLLWRRGLCFRFLLFFLYFRVVLYLWPVVLWCVVVLSCGMVHPAFPSTHPASRTHHPPYPQPRTCTYTYTYTYTYSCTHIIYIQSNRHRHRHKHILVVIYRYIFTHDAHRPVMLD